MSSGGYPKQNCLAIIYPHQPLTSDFMLCQSPGKNIKFGLGTKNTRSFSHRQTSPNFRIWSAHKTFLHDSAGLGLIAAFRTFLRYFHSFCFKTCQRFLRCHWRSRELCNPSQRTGEKGKCSVRYHIRLVVHNYVFTLSFLMVNSACVLQIQGKRKKISVTTKYKFF